MQTVCELNTFRRAAEMAAMSQSDIERLVLLLAKNPESGEELRGTGGCRKLRFALSGSARGKSGGIRVITFYSGKTLPVFLITVFAKNQKVSLSASECNALHDLTHLIVKAYRQKSNKGKVQSHD